MSTPEHVDDAIGEYFYHHLTKWRPEHFELGNRFLVSVLLITSFLYYHLHESVIPDTEYDKLCRILLDRYDEIKNDPMIWTRRYLDRDALRTGSMFYLAAKDYPVIEAGIAHYIHRRVVDDGERE